MKRLVYYLASFLEAFDISSGAIMGIWSLTMIFLSVLATLKNIVISDSVLYLYFAALGAFAGTRVSGKWIDTIKAGKVEPPVSAASTPTTGGA